jgi:hypothetical protein
MFHARWAFLRGEIGAGYIVSKWAPKVKRESSWKSRTFSPSTVVGYSKLSVNEQHGRVDELNGH